MPTTDWAAFEKSISEGTDFESLLPPELRNLLNAPKLPAPEPRSTTDNKVTATHDAALRLYQTEGDEMLKLQWIRPAVCVCAD